MDKKEILESNVSLYFSSDHGGESEGAEWHTANTPAEKIYKAMDEFAKRQCILYAHWLLKTLYPKLTPDEPDAKSEGLYNKFLTETSI